MTATCTLCTREIDVHDTDDLAATTCRHRGEVHLGCHERACLDKECVDQSCQDARCDTRTACEGCGTTWCLQHSQTHVEEVQVCSAWAETVCADCHLERCTAQECWDDPDAAYDALRDAHYERLG